MKVRVEDITREGLKLSFPWERDRLEPFLAPDDPYDIEFAAPLEVNLGLTHHGGGIEVTGNVGGTLLVTCHRCLDRFPFVLDLPLETFLARRPPVGVDVVTPREEAGGEGEDTLVEFFDGEEVDVDLLVAEEIFLALPQVLLCSENCKGLCARCGANLNREVCSCSRETHSPFAVLLNWRGNTASERI